MEKPIGIKAKYLIIKDSYHLKLQINRFEIMRSKKKLGFLLVNDQKPGPFHCVSHGGNNEKTS